MSGEKTIEQVIAACELTKKQMSELEFLAKNEPSEEERCYNDLNK